MVFIYNGGEGSATALPVAQDILRGYFALKNPPQPEGAVDPATGEALPEELPTPVDNAASGGGG